MNEATDTSEGDKTPETPHKGSGPNWVGRLVRALQFFSLKCHWFRVWGLGAFAEFGGECSDDLRWSIRVCRFKLSLGPLLLNGTVPLGLQRERVLLMRDLARKGKLGRY